LNQNAQNYPIGENIQESTLHSQLKILCIFLSVHDFSISSGFILHIEQQKYEISDVQKHNLKSQLAPLVILKKAKIK